MQPKANEIQSIQEEISKIEPSPRQGRARSLNKKEKSLTNKSIHWASSRRETKLIVELEEKVPQIQLRRCTRIWKPKLKYANAALIEDNGIREPSTYAEVAQSMRWRDTMKEEMKTLEQNET